MGDVPWSPASACTPDAGLDRYRNRVAELLEGELIVGHALVLPEDVSQSRGGHLWWRRWTPYQEIPSVSIALFDGRHFDDSWVQPKDLDAELQSWHHNQMPLLGELLTTHWLAASQSLEVARDRFLVEGFDEIGQVGGNQAAIEAASELEDERAGRLRSARPRRAR